MNSDPWLTVAPQASARIWRNRTWSKEDMVSHYSQTIIIFYKVPGPFLCAVGPPPIQALPQTVPSGYTLFENWAPVGGLTPSHCLNYVRVLQKSTCYHQYKAEVHLGGPAAWLRTSNLQDQWWQACMEEGIHKAQEKEGNIVVGLGRLARVMDWVTVKGGNGHTCTSV